MNRDRHEINDDEIRIISGKESAPRAKRRRPATKLWAILASAFLALAAIGIATLLLNKPGETGPMEPAASIPAPAFPIPDPHSTGNAYVAMTDTVVGGNRLRILSPLNATPSLHVGPDILDDPSVVMALWAADLRADNGRIVGAFVEKGSLASKGEAKAGFCAIIDGKMTIGVADATPLLEQTLETDGYFFRQYPLVVGNQVVENKPKGKALRRALAELDGEPVIVMSRERLSFHDFSQSLVDLGASNAISLVGASAYGFAVADDGQRVELGEKWAEMPANINFLVWK
ncbi:MAG: hypothetical protein NC342_01190 [Pseudoflavonifractor sp.]|nr:hypothetical protein [Alloprevotella sp.]MCM1116138.1 hypothetical protein [Pseudoflavonifractor sp.]